MKKIILKHLVPLITVMTIVGMVILVCLDARFEKSWPRFTMPVTNVNSRVFTYQTVAAEKSNEVCNEQRVWSHMIQFPTITFLSDWSLNTTVKCPPFVIDKDPKARQKVALECNGNSGRLVKSSMNSSQDIAVVEFGSKCLGDVIKKCCTGSEPVPNVIHYVWFYSTDMGFFHFLSLMSALRFVKPCLFLIHGPSIPTGKYWDYFVSVSPNVIHVKRARPTSIFGHELAFETHSSDVMRIEALMDYGGIYLDFDEVILRSLEPLRQYSYTQGREDTALMGSQLIMATRNAEFLRHWYAGYNTDYRNDWTWNALEYPHKLSEMYPHLIHVEGFNFTRPNWKKLNQIYKKNYDWSANYGIHMFERYAEGYINLETIRHLNTTVGSVSRHILFGNKELCEKETIYNEAYQYTN